MSVSMKSTKVAMYEEIERLRALVDHLESMATPARAPAVHRIDFKSEAEKRRALYEAAAQLSKKYNALARVVGSNVQLWSKKRRVWCDVPSNIETKVA